MSGTPAVKPRLHGFRNTPVQLVPQLHRLRNSPKKDIRWAGTACHTLVSTEPEIKRYHAPRKTGLVKENGVSDRQSPQCGCLAPRTTLSWLQVRIVNPLHAASSDAKNRPRLFATRPGPGRQVKFESDQLHLGSVPSSMCVPVPEADT